jgi:hypothetical protein
LAVTNILDHGLKSILVVNIESAAALRPPVLTDLTLAGASGWYGRSLAGASGWYAVVTYSLSLKFLQFARTPSFELAAHVLRPDIRGHDNMYVVRAAIHGVQLPTADPAMLSNGLFYHCTLVPVQDAGAFRHSCLRLQFADGVRRLPAASSLHPAAFIARQPCPVGSPSEIIRQRIRHRRFIGPVHSSARRAEGPRASLAGASPRSLAGASGWYAAFPR